MAKQLDPGWIYHMSDQHLGWWSRPGGGLYVLEDFKSGSPWETCLTGGFPEGCFQRPMLSWDGARIVFAYCQFCPGLAENRDNMPFMGLWRMNPDGTQPAHLFGNYTHNRQRSTRNVQVVGRPWRPAAGRGRGGRGRG